MTEINKSNISTAIYRHRRKLIRIIITPLKRKYKYYLMRIILVFSTQVTYHGSSKTTANLRLRIANEKEIRWYTQKGTVSFCYAHPLWWKSRTFLRSSRADPWSIYPFYGIFWTQKLSVHYTAKRLCRHKTKKDVGFEVPSAALLNSRLGYVCHAEMYCTQLVTVWDTSRFSET
jgi:hypothetical protein